MAMANAMAFFVRMGTFAHWQGGGCDDNGGGNVLELAAVRSGSGQLKESEWGE